MTVKVYDLEGTQIGTLTEAVVQLSNDRHAIHGGYVGGFYDEIQEIYKGHYHPVVLKDDERTYYQCWLHSKATLLGKKHAVFSFTYYEGKPIEVPKDTVAH
ncbi:MAG: hypothetical protein N2450_09490 [bacterium]|nr:hypothetical protein [bacterium]